METAETEFLQAIQAGTKKTALKILVKGRKTFTQKGLDHGLLEVCRAGKGNSSLVCELLRSGANIQAVSEDGDTPLLVAIKSGDSFLIKDLIEKGADINAINAEGDSALILSVQADTSLFILKLLLKQSGIDIDHKNHRGYTAFMKAVETKNIKAVQLLIDEHKSHRKETLTIGGENLDNSNIILNYFGQAVLDIAIGAGMEKIIKLLLHIKEEESPLMGAVLRGDVELIKTFIDPQCYGIGREDHVDFTTFLRAFLREKKHKGIPCGDGDISVVKLLLENGADVNLCEETRRLSRLSEAPLITAVQGGSLELVQLMCKYGANLDVTRPYENKTPLHLAAESGRADILQILLDNGAKVNSPGAEKEIPYGLSALHSCLMYGHINCAKILLDYGALIDIPYEVEYAIKGNKEELLKFLVERFASGVQSFMHHNIEKCNELLTPAIAKNSIEIINSLHEAGVKVPHDLLYQATSAAMVQLLVQNGADVHRKEDNDNSVLFISIYLTTDKEITKVLLENGARANDANVNEETSLMLATIQQDGNSDLLNVLLLYGAEVNIKDVQGNTALMHALDKDCPENADFFIGLEDEQEVNIHVENNLGETALTLAARNGFTNAVKKLIAKGADINHQNKDGYSAMMLAAEEHHEDSIAVLLDAGADVNHVRNNGGETALTLAAKYGCTNAVEKLIAKGADINHQNKEGYSAMMLAAEKHHGDTIAVLLDAGADVNHVANNGGETALTLSAKYGCTNAVEKLIAKGADINHQNKDGYSALMLAAENHHGDSIAVLLDAGADKNLVSREKLTAMLLLFRPAIDTFNISAAVQLMDLFISRGASSSCLRSDVLFDIIKWNQWKYVPKLVSSGFGPPKTYSVLYNIISDIHPPISAFLFALLNGYPSLARYFDGIWYLCDSDLHLQANHASVRRSLVRKRLTECDDYLCEFSSQPMSLLKLSFVTVSSTIGRVTGREEKINQLPLPQLLKDKLLFKRQVLHLDIP